MGLVVPEDILTIASLTTSQAVVKQYDINILFYKYTIVAGSVNAMAIPIWDDGRIRHKQI
jgi:hypothetical protein